MYSKELENLIVNGKVSKENYEKFFNPRVSPQISYAKYNDYTKEIEVGTYDGYYFIFTIE